MKKIFVFLASLAFVFVMTNPANAANCYCSPWDYFQQVDCGSAPQTGHLSINRGSDSRLYVQGEIHDAGSGAPHNWDWWMYHDGDLSASGTNASGDFTANRLMVNFAGAPDYVKFVVKNDGRTITCSQDINVYG